MPNYRRSRVPGACYFFTVTLADRDQTLLVDHIDLLRASVRRVKSRRPFIINAWVTLPDHLHCIWTLPEGDDDFPNRWKAIKGSFSKQLPNDATPPARARYLAATVLGTPNQERRGLLAAFGLHPLEPGQTRLGKPCDRVAVFILSPGGEGGDIPTQLG